MPSAAPEQLSLLPHPSFLMATPSGSTSAATAAAAAATASVSKPTHRYTTEIAQMCYVFHGEPKEGGEDEVVQYLEDIVRAQLGEVVSRYLSFHSDVL